MGYIGLSCSTFSGHLISLGSIMPTITKFREISRRNSCGHRVVLVHTVPTSRPSTLFITDHNRHCDMAISLNTRVVNIKRSANTTVFILRY
jgi:hypothetical protein